MGVLHVVRISALVASLLLPTAAVVSVVPAVASETVPAQLGPDVEVIGDLSVEYGAPVELQLIPTPNTALKMWDLPAWLSYDWTTKRVTGTAPGSWSDYQFTLYVRNSHDAITKTVILSVRPNMLDNLDPDVIEVPVVNEVKPGSRAGTFSGTCPSEYPYLARFSDKYRDHFKQGAKNDLAPGRLSPGGVRVIEPSGIAVSVAATGQQEIELNGLFGRHDQVSYKTGITGDYMNWNIDSTPLTVTMLCTSDTYGYGTTLHDAGSIA